MPENDPFLNKYDHFERTELSSSEDELWSDLQNSISDDLKSHLDAIELSSEMPFVPDEIGQDAAVTQMQDTFIDMVRNSLNPIARYMKALDAGEDAKEIYEITELIITPLIPKVEQVGLISHAEDLTFFRSLILLALGESDSHAKMKLKQVVIEGFVEIQKGFNLYCRGYRKAVLNLVELYRTLKRIESLDEIDIRRLFAVGIPSLTWFRKMKTVELASLSGVTEEKIVKIKQIASHGTSVMHFAAAELDRNTKGQVANTYADHHDSETSIPELEVYASLERKIF